MPADKDKLLMMSKMFSQAMSDSGIEVPMRQVVLICCTTLPKDWAPFEKMPQTPVSHVRECQWGWSSSCLRSLLQKTQTWYVHRILYNKVPLIVTLSVGYKMPRRLSTMASKHVRALWPKMCQIVPWSNVELKLRLKEP